MTAFEGWPCAYTHALIPLISVYPSDEPNAPGYHIEGTPIYCDSIKNAQLKADQLRITNYKIVRISTNRLCKSPAFDNLKDFKS